MTVLPRFIVLKSNINDKYLKYMNEEKTEAHGHLTFSGNDITNPFSKFQVEMPKSGDHGVFHLRSCYNNKYWVRSQDGWLLATADQPEEDTSESSCTLFKALFVDEAANTLRIMHVKSGFYACLWRVEPPLSDSLYAGYQEHDASGCDIFTINDWESLLLMPKHVAFKGDNGKYLTATWIEGHECLQFVADDKGDERTSFEVFTIPDGHIRIKSNYFRNFWRRSPNWIWADSNDTTTNNRDTLFWPFKVNNNTVALRNLGNDNYCQRLTTEGKTSCLNAAVHNVAKEAQLLVEELVFSREIYNVRYRFKDARMYNEKTLIAATSSASNNTDVANTLDVKLQYEDTKSYTWKASTSLKLGVKTNLNTNLLFIVDGNIEVSAEFQAGYEFGDTKTETKILEVLYKANVPAMSKVTVNLVAKHGWCDVPFSYTQRDKLYSGNDVLTEMDDGIYICDNYFSLHYDTSVEKII